MLEYHFNKVAGLNFIKKRLQHKCFPVNNAKLLRAAFYRRPPVEFLFRYYLIHACFKKYSITVKKQWEYYNGTLLKSICLFIQKLYIGEKPSWEVFCKKRFLRNFAKFTEKHLCQSLFF